jgi:hypothetical protein
VILLPVPPMLTVSQVPVTVSVLFDPATFRDFPLAQSRVAVVLNDPYSSELPISTEVLTLLPPDVVGVAAALVLVGAVVVVPDVPDEPPGGLAVELQPASPKAAGATVSAATRAASRDEWSNVRTRIVC